LQEGRNVNTDDKRDLTEEDGELRLAAAAEWDLQVSRFGCYVEGEQPGGKRAVIRVSGVNADEVQRVSQALLKDEREAYANARVGPWASGSFYLLAILLTLALLGVLASGVRVWMLPVLVVGGVLGLSVIGGLQLRQDGALSERGFIELMGLTLRQLPVVRHRSEPEDE
jgi:hypothetical protein